MDDETKKVYACRDVVFNEIDFGKSDHGTVLELKPSINGSRRTVSLRSLCPRIKTKCLKRGTG